MSEEMFPQLSLEQLQVILRGVAEGITVQRPDGGLVYANEKAAALVGYPSPEALIAAPVIEIMRKFELMDEDGRPFPLSQLPGRLALQGQQPADVVVCFRALDGEHAGAEQWSIVSATPVFDNASQVQFAVNIFRDISERMRSLAAERAARAEAEAARRRQEFLAQASAVLAESLDYETTLQQVARLAVPHIADWCAVDLLEADETINRVAVEHIDPAKIALVFDLQRRYPSEPDENSPLYTGQPLIFPEIPDELLVTAAQDADHLDILRQLTLKSVMVTPLKARGRVLGTLSLATAESGRTLGQDDLVLAEGLASRAALAVENARLYAEARQLNDQLELRVADRTAVLQQTNDELQEAHIRLELEIEERRQAEEGLRRSEALYRTIARNIPNGSVTVVDQDLRLLFAEGIALARHGLVREQLEGRSLLEAFPAELAEARTPYYQAALNGVPSTMELVYEGYVYLTATTPLRNERGEVYAALALAQDVTSLKQAEEKLRRRAQEVEALARMGQVATASLDLQQVLDRVLEQLTPLLPAENISILLREYGPTGAPSLQVVATTGPNTAEGGQPFIPERSGRNDDQTLLTVPLTLRGQVIGVMSAVHSQPAALHARHLQLLEAAANWTAIAIGNARQHERLRHLTQQLVSAQEQERRRLAGELHDEAGQALTALKMSLSLLRATPSAAEAEDGEPSWQEQLDGLIELADQTMEQIRLISHGLRPPMLDRMGLNAALESLGRDFATRTGLTVAYQSDTLPDLPDLVAVTFYRFLQEALTNIAKHAQATEVQVSLNCEAQTLQLQVSDNGNGFDPAAGPAMIDQGKGMGLLGMQERLTLLNGELQIHSEPGQGTRLVARCQIRPA